MKQCLLYVYSFNFINYLYIFSSSNISPVISHYGHPWRFTYITQSTRFCC